MNGWFGISSLESFAHGIPVIAGLDIWNTNAIKEFTGSDILPWVIACDEGELEREIRSLVDEPERRLAVGRQSRQFMESCWTEQHVLQPLQRTYENL